MRLGIASFCRKGYPYLHILTTLLVFIALLVRYVKEYEMAFPIYAENWMERLPLDISNHVKLKDLVIPGSHDSATFDLNPVGGKAADFSSYIDMPDDKIERWFKTQNLDFISQLKAGVRYFDLRIIKNASNGGIYFVHGLYSKKLITEYLKNIRTFVEENKREVVILDFNHIYEMDFEDHNPLCVEIEEIFSGMMLDTRKCKENGMSPTQMTLSQIWDMNGQVIVLYGNSRACSKTQHIWPRHEIDLLWPYTPRQEMVVPNLVSEYQSLHRDDILIVWHGILTPHSDGNFLERLKTYKDLREYVSPTTKEIVLWIESKPKVNLNIMCADFVEEHRFIETVIKANFN